MSDLISDPRDIPKLQFLLEAWAEELDCSQGAVDRSEPEMIRALASKLPSLFGSISERETLTAEVAKMEKICAESIEVVDIAHARIVELEAAVARLTTEKAAFQDWFQNAEQARAVAESWREQAMRDIEALPRLAPKTDLRTGVVGMGEHPLGNGKYLDRSAVLSIVRGSNP